MPALRVVRKWRPPLWLVVVALVLVLVTLPVAGLVLARLAESQFVRETERSLIAQAAVFAEVYQEALVAAEEDLAGRPLSQRAARRLAETYHPVEPSLTMSARDIRGPAPEGRPLPHPPLPAYRAAAERLEALAAGAQRTTLAGYRFADSSGQIVASSGAGVGSSLLHLPEVQGALSGQVQSILRLRDAVDERHPLSSISRDTGFRVHVAYPVIAGDRVLGVVYASRTPLNLQKFLYNERALLLRMAAVTVLGALLLGYIFWRFVSRPIGALRAQSHEVATGVKPAPEPLAHYGVSELADLGQSVLSMARTLTERSDALRTYTDHVTHELKSPVTSIVGAAEILSTTGERLEPDRRARLLSTIRAEGLRMDALLSRLRELAQARTMTAVAPSSLSAVLGRVAEDFPHLDLVAGQAAGLTVPMAPEALEMLLAQLLRNASEHGATRVVVTGTEDGHGFLVEDNGTGVSAANQTRVFDPFFTTKRDSGGTGMGLTIVSALVHRHGGRVSLCDRDQGAAFWLTFGDA